MSRSSDEPFFDEAGAARYDDDPMPMVDGSPIEAAVEVLASLADGGEALEFGIGTGRVAIPLASRGVAVHGIDSSEPMLRRLRAKPGGGDVHAVRGDFASTRVDGSFLLVFLVFNTIENVTSQAAQAAVFRNAAAHLRSGGTFVVEVTVPDLRRLPPGERFVVFDVGEEHWGIDEYDVASQGLISHHLSTVDGTLLRSSGSFRYVWPSELDLMAELAGLRLRSRWGGWGREPFTNESRMHVSIWEKP